jgi:hypothetical protein
MDDLIQRYNYDSFTPEKFGPWLNFGASPALGVQSPDFPLWALDQSPTRLSAILEQYAFTIVEFGSFT